MLRRALQHVVAAVRGSSGGEPAARSAAAALELEEISMALHDRLPTSLSLGEVRRLAALSVDELERDEALEVTDYSDVGAALFHGEGGVKHDAAKAAAVWFIGSERGCVASRYSYAMSLSSGHGVERDSLRAYAMLAEIIDENEADERRAVAEVGEGARAALLHGGSGAGAPAADKEEAASTSAAARSSSSSSSEEASKAAAEKRWQVGASALFAAAQMLQQGNGVSINGPRAVALYQRAAAAGKTEACYSLAELYRYGVSSAAISSTADDSTDVKTIAVDDKKAAQWLRMSAKMGDANGLFGLGLAFCEGRGVTQSWEEGLKHTVAAAERGLPHAIFNVGNHYYLGQGVKQDYARGVKEYKRAAEMGFVFAQTNLAIALIKGTGVPTPDVAEARKWLTLAAPHSEHAAKILDELDGEGEGNGDGG
mgnify:CR=1 FL=1|tara:strand:- start:52 stop:1329 length:1278 start_codon:yes stop_codon:yes gene_type:complete